MRGSDYKDYKQIGEHTIPMPKLTKSSDVLFLKEKDAFWRRDLLENEYKQIFYDFIPFHTKVDQPATLYDQDDVLASLNTEDSNYIRRVYEQEMRRRREGVFMKNGNEIIHLDGNYYFILRWCKTKRPDKKSEYFDFREYQNEDALLCTYVERAPLILGYFASKAKKTGITNLRWLYYLNKAGMTKNVNLANMNIDQDKGAKTFRDYFMYAYNNLIPAFKATIKTKSEADGRITFGKQYRNTKKSVLTKNDSSDDMNTTVMCVPTLPHACDVDVFDTIWFDEAVKYKTDFGEIYRSNMSGTSIQDDIIGKLWLTNYTPEENSPSFLSAKQLFYDSELRTLNPITKQTSSKLICHHIPAYQSWSTSFDKYGKCDEIDAMRRIQSGRNALKSKPRELQGEIRKYANDKKEAWAIGGTGSVLDAIRLSDLLSNVEKDQRESPMPIFQEGKLEWKNKMWEIGLKNKRPKGQFCEVEFIPLTQQDRMNDEKGRLRIYQDLPKNLQNLALKQGRDEFGFLLPPAHFLNVLGADPTSHAAASEVIEGSKNAYICMNRADHRIDAMYGKVMTRVINFVYFDRPELPDEAYEDLLKLLIYTGSLTIVEANVPEMATRLMNEGLGHYLIVKDKDGLYTTWKPFLGLPEDPDKKYHFIRTTSNSQDTKDRLELFIKLMKNYIAVPVEGEKDYGASIGDERLLDQLMRIDIKDTKKIDMVMAWGYCLMADDIYSGLLLAPDSTKEELDGLKAFLNALEAA